MKDHRGTGGLARCRLQRPYSDPFPLLFGMFYQARQMGRAPGARYWKARIISKMPQMMA